MVDEDTGVSCSLRLDELAECKRPVGDLEVLNGGSRDLQEDPDRRPTLVELTGGVQESRTPSEGHGATEAGREHVAEFLELRVRHAVDVGLDREVAVVADGGEQGVHGSAERGGAGEHFGRSTHLD